MRRSARSDPGENTRPVVAVIAVKRLSDGKSRLANELTVPQRRDLALAMLLDVMTAVDASPVDGIVVVSPDHTVQAAAGEHGAVIVDDSPKTDSLRTTASGHRSNEYGEQGLNHAFTLGADQAAASWPGPRLILVQADLPAARPASLIDILEQTRNLSLAVLPDRTGAGTVLLTLDDPSDAASVVRFGANSAAAHRQRGAIDLTRHQPADRWADLRTDVDTVTDVVAASELGVGVHTTDVLRALRASGGLLANIGCG